jgi:hypothetical protein
MACRQTKFRSDTIPPAAAGSREAQMMPTINRPTGRFFAVLISLMFAILMTRPAVAGGPAPPDPKHNTPAPTLCQITEGLFGSKSGSDKKAAAISFAEAAVGVTDAVANKNIVDNGKFQDGLGKVIDGVVACLNASVWEGKQ